MLRFLILSGYFELVMYLQVSGKLNQYINIHYSYLAYISMVLSFILAVVQLIVWMKQIKVHSHLSGRVAKVASIVLLAFPVLTGLLVPTVTLDANTVSAKGYHFPLAAGSDPNQADQEGTTIQYLKPDTSSYFTSSAYEKEMTRELAKYKGRETIQKITWKSWSSSTSILTILWARRSPIPVLSTMTHKPRVISSSSVSVLSTVSPIQVFTDWRQQEVTKPSRTIPG